MEKVIDETPGRLAAPPSPHADVLHHLTICHKICRLWPVIHAVCRGGDSVYRHFPISVGAGVLILVRGVTLVRLLPLALAAFTRFACFPREPALWRPPIFCGRLSLGAFVMTTSDQLSEESSNARFGLASALGCCGFEGGCFPHQGPSQHQVTSSAPTVPHGRGPRRCADLAIRCPEQRMRPSGTVLPG